jgi:hypothetical protein
MRMVLHLIISRPPHRRQRLLPKRLRPVPPTLPKRREKLADSKAVPRWLALLWPSLPLLACSKPREALHF